MIIDANVLPYAIDEQSHFHTSMRMWLEEAINGAERVGLPWASLMAFQRIITHPRIGANPLKPADAWRCIIDWPDANQAWMPNPGDCHSDILEGFLIDGDLRENFVTDAHLAVLAVEYGTGTCSLDSDFAHFDGIRWINPDRGQHHRSTPKMLPPTRSWGNAQWLSPIPRALVRQVRD